MAEFNYSDVLILIGIAQGLFLSGTLPIMNQKNLAANKILALLLLLACLILSTRLILFKATELRVMQRIILFEPAIFLFGILGYTYLVRLLQKDRATYRLPWFYFLPACIYLVYLMKLNTYTAEEFGNFYATGVFDWPFLIAEASAITVNFFFWTKSIVFLNKFKAQEKRQFSFDQKSVQYITVMVILSGFVLLMWIVSTVSAHLFKTVIPYLNYNTVWIALPVIIYVLGFFALGQPEIFRVRNVGPKVRDERKKDLMEQVEIDQLSHRLQFLMEEEKIYLDNELTLVQLANALETSTNKLSWLFNTVYDSTFYDFINDERINAYLNKLKAKEHRTKTLSSLAFEVGFNSKSTFNKAFKARLQKTPSSYLKSL